MSKPIILWLADQPGWAFDAIAQAQKQALPQYEHRVVYIMGDGVPGKWSNEDAVGFGVLQAEADIIVPMFLLYLQFVCMRFKKKAAVMLTGFRPFERVSQ